MIDSKYDRTVDAFAVTFRPGRSAKTVRVSETVRVDLDAKGRIVALELLDASWHLPKDALAVEYTLDEAERVSGIRSSTLRVQLNKGRLKGRKRGREWVVDAEDLANYLASRGPQGRPSESPRGRRKVV